MVLDRRTVRVLGVPSLGRRGISAKFLTMSVANGARLKDLALMEYTGSTDISAVLEAAREGMG